MNNSYSETNKQCQHFHCRRTPDTMNNLIKSEFKVPGWGIQYTRQSYPWNKHEWWKHVVL